MAYGDWNDLVGHSVFSAGTPTKPLSKDASVSDPRIAEKKFIKEYAKVFSEIMGRAHPITEDKQAARRAFNLHLNVAQMKERLVEYQGDDDFKKDKATSFWIVNRLERDLSKEEVRVSRPGRDLGA